MLLLLLLQNKDTTDSVSRPRGTNYSSSRGGRAGTDRYAGRGSANQFSSSGMRVMGAFCHYCLLFVCT